MLRSLLIQSRKLLNLSSAEKRDSSGIGIAPALPGF